MTLTIDLPPAAEAQLRQEARRAGVPVPEMAGRFLLERLQPAVSRIDRLIADISAPIDVADISREAIYAE